MEGGRRSGDPSGYVVKSKSSKGCLIVRKKTGDGAGGVGPSGSRKAFDPKQEKKRLRTNLSDSGSSDEPLMQSRRRVSSATVKVCNGLSGYEKGVAEDSDVRRKRSREQEIKQNEIGLIRRNGEDIVDRKRNKLGVFEFDEYEGNDGGMIRGKRRQLDDDDEEVREGLEKRYMRSMVGSSGIQIEYEMGSSTHAVADGRKSSYFERASGLGQGGHGDRHRAESSMPFWRDRYDSDEPIRVQGKNGVLKVMVNKKKKVGGSFHGYDTLEAEDTKKLRSEECVKKNPLVRPAFYANSKSSEKGNSFCRKQKSPMNVLKPLSSKNGKLSDRDSENSDMFSNLGPKNMKGHKSAKSPLLIRKRKDQDMNSDDSDMSLKPGQKIVDTCKPIKGVSIRGEKTPSNQLPTARTPKEKVKRGTSTEKQKLRERIREMLINSGWTIDYRPRRNRDYLDAVYINPSGTAYWSIVKAYDALQKQLNEDEDDLNSGGDGSPFMPLSNKVLSQLTRNTRKKIEKEMKKKQRDADEREKAREATAKISSRTSEDGDSSSQEQKLSSFIKKGYKLMKARMKSSSFVRESSKGQSLTRHLDDINGKPPSGSNSHYGRKSKKLGRCTLLIRNSNSGQNLENGGFVPYAGKRTLLSWLIDCGAVHLSQKVRYMNCRRTKVMLEGWVTHEGIHCGCCSKILTVSKFEIHAGSKLRQPFQNIYLDSGISLLDCQIEAWSRQESAESIGFHFVDTDGDDPNDDTCGLCGDGGDLICCDGCPSTFHQNCLDIKMLPPGDWHCPNCTCKFCGLVGGSSSQEDDSNVSALPICSLCAKKCHESCTQEMDTCPVDTNISVPCFCGNRCRELFEQLRRFLGVKHELDAGFTWSLIHRVDEDLESYLGLPQRVECNSKLAVALSVMDECFLPIVDRRSGINLLQSVLYNCGSNFNRLNFSGFYAVILERGEEIISAASIRFHGTELAEMPFIGTRHMYRRQGMCRRLFQAIESALSSMKVENLIIPAISDLTNTWTNVFGFTNLDESLKQKLKSMNMLVFPGIDMLQKQLVKQEIVKRNKNPSTARQECLGSNNSDVERASKTEVPMALDSDSQCPDFSLNDASVMTGPLDALHENKAGHADEYGDKLVESALDKKSLAISDKTHGAEQKDNKSESNSTIESNCESSIQDDTSSMDSVLDQKNLCISDGNHDVRVKDVKPEASSLVKDNAESCILGDTVAVDSDVQLTDIPLEDSSVLCRHLDASGDLQNPASLEGIPFADSKLEDQLPESASDGKSPIISNTSFDGGEENDLKPISPAKEDNLSSKTADECNASPLNRDESASNDLQISISFTENNKPLDKLDKQDSNVKTLVKTDTGKDELDMESMPVRWSPIEVIAQSCGGATSNEAEPTNVDDACRESTPSTEQRAVENYGKQIDEISSVSVTSISGSIVNSSPSDSEQNKEHPDGRGIKINPTVEAVGERRNDEGDN